jgi:acyl carrier protein
MNIINEVTDIIRDIFEDQTLNFSPSLNANDVYAWDSITHINLIVAIENKFAIKFTDNEIFEFKNIGELVESIRLKMKDV